MYDSVLVPTDGSADMATVAEHGLRVAGAFGATVHVLYVVDERAYASVPEDRRERIRDTLAEDGHDATRSVAERAVEGGIDAVREVRWGNPPAAILSYAVENDVDLVVMGTHGRTGYERYLLGSVAEKVVRAAPVPVLTVPVGDHGEEATVDGVTLG